MHPLTVTELTRPCPHCESARQDFHPRIYLTDSDFASITLDGKLCDAKGQLGLREFEDVMRRQMVEMIQEKLVLDRGLRSPLVPGVRARGIVASRNS